MKKLFILLAALSAFTANPARADTGPTQLLQIETWYQVTQSNGMYIQFKGAGAMPGCYAVRGGYFMYSEPNFDRLYATFMTILAKGSMRGAVIFDKVAGVDPAASWGACNIKGLLLTPE
jgi:hypothetical protein